MSSRLFPCFDLRIFCQPFIVGTRPNYFGYFEWGGDVVSGGGSMIPFGGGIRRSPFPFGVIGIEARLGYLSGEFMWGIALAPGFVFPLSENIRMFGDVLFEVGSFAGMDGLIARYATPAFSAGLFFLLGNEWLGFDIRYRGTWLREHYLHSIGIGIVFNFSNNF